MTCVSVPKTFNSWSRDHLNRKSIKNLLWPCCQITSIPPNWHLSLTKYKSIFVYSIVWSIREFFTKNRGQYFFWGYFLLRISSGGKIFTRRLTRKTTPFWIVLIEFWRLKEPSSCHRNPVSTCQIRTTVILKEIEEKVQVGDFNWGDRVERYGNPVFFLKFFLFIMFTLVLLNKY